MEIIESREAILNTLDKMFKDYITINDQHSQEMKEIINKNTELDRLNKKLFNEISEKDKLLVINDKKMYDYEQMINKIQDEANKELTDKERFDMLRKQDKEIYERDLEINRLQRKVASLEEEMKLTDKGNIDIRIQDMNTETEENNPQFIYDKEEEVETDVVDKEEEVETDVVDKEEEVETEDMSSEEEQETEVNIITHYKKEFYIVVNESPQYIYAIDDNQLGEKVGEIINGKKKFYKSSKK